MEMDRNLLKWIEVNGNGFKLLEMKGMEKDCN